MTCNIRFSHSSEIFPRNQNMCHNFTLFKIFADMECIYRLLAVQKKKLKYDIATFRNIAFHTVPRSWRYCRR